MVCRFLYCALLLSSPASRNFVVSTSLVTAPFIFSVITAALPGVMASIFSSATLNCLQASITTFMVSPSMIVQGTCAWNCLFPDLVCMMLLCKNKFTQGCQKLHAESYQQIPQPVPIDSRHFPSCVQNLSHQVRKRRSELIKYAPHNLFHLGKGNSDAINKDDTSFSLPPNFWPHLLKQTDEFK